MVKVILLRVLRSHTLIDPLLEPTITCSSDLVKVRAVSVDTLLLMAGLRTAIGLGLTRLYRIRLLSSSPTAKLFFSLYANRPQSILFPMVW